MDEGAELKHGVTCLRSRTIENSLIKPVCGAHSKKTSANELALNSGIHSTFQLESCSHFVCIVYGEMIQTFIHKITDGICLSINC